jgi:EAL domain-containing protein (putative c-di-GMP-specific phosphodiesterase class I)/CheY-like chemotaxis protein
MLPPLRVIAGAIRWHYGPQMSSVGTPPILLAEPIRVLLADDEPALRAALSELFSHEDGVELVGTAGDADEAIALARVVRPDVALVDVKMPMGGGPRAAREIQRESPSTRVIALSAFEDRPTVLEMLKAGAVGYLVKGSAAEQIVDSIARVADGGTSLSAEVVGGIVHELSSQLRRDEIELQERTARAGAIQRFLTGDGLSMAFQPIVDLRDRRIAGMEALARFRSLPLRPPNEWFAEAVTLELGVQLELATIRQALAALPRLPPQTYLSVNCSHRAAMSPQLVMTLEPVAKRIVVEITEHEEVGDYHELVDALSGLRSLGARVAIDDAGAGYASLRHTLQLAPDIVKVDISLTRDIDTDRGKRAMASALVAFADEMDISIVAEGIETEAEMRTLQELGVRYGQGYYLAMPGEIEEADQEASVSSMRGDPSPTMTRRSPS